MDFGTFTHPKVLINFKSWTLNSLFVRPWAWFLQAVIKLTLATVIVDNNNTIFIFIYTFSPFLSKRQTPGVIFVLQMLKCGRFMATNQIFKLTWRTIENLTKSIWPIKAISIIPKPLQIPHIRLYPCTIKIYYAFQFKLPDNTFQPGSTSIPPFSFHQLIHRQNR